MIEVQQKSNAMRRQGRRWGAMKRVHVVTKRKMKTVEERASLEKFVNGVITLRTVS